MCSYAVCETYFCRDADNGCSATCSECEQTFCRDHTFGCELCDRIFCVDCRKIRGDQYCQECYRRENLGFGEGYLDEDDEEEYNRLGERTRELEARRTQIDALAKKRKQEFDEDAEQLRVEREQIERKIKRASKRRRVLRNERDYSSDSDEEGDGDDE